eukprot:gene23955-32354_t
MAQFLEESEFSEEVVPISRGELEREFGEWNEPDCFIDSYENGDAEDALYNNNTSYKDLYYDPSKSNEMAPLKIKGLFSDQYFSSGHDLLAYERDTNDFNLEKIVISAVEDDAANTSSSKDKPFNCMVTVVLIVNFIRSQMQTSEPPSVSTLLQQLSAKMYLLESEKYMVSLDGKDLLLPVLLDHFSALLSPDEDDEDDEEEEDVDNGHGIDKLQTAREKIEHFDEIMSTLNSSED